MENYLAKCLESLLIPDFEAVEVLVVNDGSKDRSSEIAHSYAARYPDSIRVIDKQNGNYGSCINAALPLVTGRYVKVLDADDTFDTNAFQKLVEKLPITKSDLVITDMVIVDENQKITDIAYRSEQKFDDGHNYNLQEKILVLEGISMHSIAYCTDVFQRISYKQTEGVSYTDNEWIFLPVSVCKSVIYYNIGNLYHYLIGRNGQTMDPNVYVTKFSDVVTVNIALLRTYEYWKNNSVVLHLNYLRNRLKCNLYRSYFRSLSLKSRSYSGKLKKFDNEVLKISPEIYQELGNIPYNDHTSFYLVRELRKINFIESYSIPRIIRIKSVLTKSVQILFGGKL